MMFLSKKRKNNTLSELTDRVFGADNQSRTGDLILTKGESNRMNVPFYADLLAIC